MIPDFPIDIRIRLAELNFFLLLPDFANSLPCWLSQQNWASHQGRKLAKSGSNKKKIQFCQSYSYVNRKVWHRQIWIPNNLGFMVLILTYIHKSEHFWNFWSKKRKSLRDICLWGEKKGRREKFKKQWNINQGV